MLKKIFNTFLLFIIAAIFLTFLLRGHLLKTYIIGYAKNNLRSTCTIGKIHLSSKSIQIKNLNLNNKDTSLNFKSIVIPFDIFKLSRMPISGVSLDSAMLKINNLKRIKNMFPATKGASGGATMTISLFNFDLNDISINLEQASEINLNANLSLKGKIENNNVMVDNIVISQGNLRGANFKANNLTLRKHNQDLYKLNISDLTIGSKGFKNINIPLKIKVNKVIFPRAANIFFGPEAYATGVFCFGGKEVYPVRKYPVACHRVLPNFTNTGFPTEGGSLPVRQSGAPGGNTPCEFSNGIYLDADFENVSFENIISIIAGEDNATIRGTFNGNLTLYWDGDKLIKLAGSFHNKEGGFINIKKETSLDFIKNYLDALSYKALIDNLKNYEYNIGEISIVNERDILSLKMDFSSEKMGRRNLIINLHNILEVK
ncbi:MAG: hypothetical protein Q8O30_07740 [Candidatus Omnitrophota bacterium]|nr:hypothetical protein [Candidatus Omnitrophota bacterium]